MNKISIITTVYNGEKTIEKTIKSIIEQSYKNFEYIIVDANSKDKTLEIINRYKNSVTKIISEPDKSIYEGMNKGINVATGSIIGILNSGDTFFKDSLKIINNYFENNKDLDFVFGTVLKDKLRYEYNPKKIWWSFNFYPAHSGGFFVKTSNHKEIGLYNTKYKCSADYDFFYKLIVTHKKKGTITKKEEVISKFETSGHSTKLTMFDHIIEEANIRIDNKQNKILVLVMFILRFFKNYFKL